MKWYKHISDSLDDPFIFDLINLYGADGYLVFFGILEIYSREFKTEDKWKLNVTQSYLTQKLHKRQSTLVVKILKHIKNSGKWDIELIDSQVVIFIPKFQELLDDWSQRKLRSCSEVTPKILKLNKNKIKEERVKNKEKDNKPKGVFVIPEWIPEETWKAYLEVRNKKRAAKTDYSLNLIIKELEKYPNKLEILNQSIKNGWIDMYPLKENKTNGKPFIKQESPYDICKNCGSEYRRGENMKIGNKYCCPKCPEFKNQKIPDSINALTHNIGGIIK
jgi:hypothetical protein